MRVPAYYLFRPRQLLTRRTMKRRSAAARSGGSSPTVLVTVPWGLPLMVDLRDAIGHVIAVNGLWDLVVTEAIFRLLDRGETAVDVGANIGYMAGVMAAATGRDGRVIAFEPQPQVFRALDAHCASWAGDPRLAKIELHDVAVSDADGEATLTWHGTFETNRGSATLAHAGSAAASARVPTMRLDSLTDLPRIDLLKIDVEGHEGAVLQGASRLLERHAIRDVIFEDHDGYPTPRSTALERLGYAVFALREGTLRPMLNQADAPPQSGRDPSYLATADETRARARFARPGWQSLRPRRLEPG